MTVEDSRVPIIGSDTERLENGVERRSETEEENMINKETITVEDEGMDKGGWAWVVVLGELLFITRSTILFLLAGDALNMTMVMVTLTSVTCPCQSFLPCSLVLVQHGDRWPRLLLWGAPRAHSKRIPGESTNLLGLHRYLFNSAENQTDNSSN